MLLRSITSCLPSSATIDNLFSVARAGSLVPDISLDDTLQSFLSLDSSAALEQHYADIQQHLSAEQLTVFNQDLTSLLGGSTNVALGGVGVVALALSLLFDVLAHKAKRHGDSKNAMDPTKMIFGISNSSRIGSLISEYLKLVPEIANDMNKMAEVTELYDQYLKYELIDHFERMTNKKRMGSVAMKQWLCGASFHLHMRIHEIRLGSVPRGSAEALRLSYKTAFTSLVKLYTAHLRKNIQETPPEPGANSMPGLLVIEPHKNVTHRVQHSPCESKVIGDALLTRIIAAQEIEASKDFFLQSEHDFYKLINQREGFELQKSNS